MSVYKQKGSPFWYYEFSRGGRRFRGSTGETSKLKARGVERAEIAKAEKSLAAPVTGNTITLGQIAVFFWEHFGQLDRDADTTWGRIETVVDGIGQDVQVGDMDDQKVAAWVIKRRAMRGQRTKRLLAPATVNREIEMLRRMLNKCRKPMGYTMPDIDWRDMRRPEPKARVIEMTAEEEAAFFAALRIDAHPIFRHYLLTGVRKSMACGLLKSDLDFDHGWVTFRGKARPGAPEASEHRLPITPALRAIYMAALQDNETDHVFTYVCQRTHKGSKPGQRAQLRGERYELTPDQVDILWKRARKIAAETCPSIARLRLHDLRHTAATRFYRDTKNLMVTQRLLGHSELRTTQKYTHVSDEDLSAAMQKHHADQAPAPTVIKEKKA